MHCTNWKKVSLLLYPSYFIHPVKKTQSHKLPHIHTFVVRFYLPDDMLKFLLRCRPHGFKPNGLSHSYTATATAVIFNDVNIAIHNSGENGNKKANNGISDLVFGAAKRETPL